MPHSTKSGFVTSLIQTCRALFRQVLFVLERVPDILDVIVILESIQQLAHQLELIGSVRRVVVMGDHGQIVGEDLVALLLHCLDDSGVVSGSVVISAHLRLHRNPQHRHPGRPS